VNKLVEVENGMLKSDLTEFGPGDTMKVYFRVHEGKKDKVQAFQGVCIQIRGSGPNRSFTLRKISQGIGIERIFPVHSPVIEKIEVVRYGKVRRAKLYYLRDKVGKGRYVKERIVRKTQEAKPRKRRRKKSKTAGQPEPVLQPVAGEVVEEVAEEASGAASDATVADTVTKDASAADTETKNSPPEAVSKEATDAATESGSQSVEES